MSTQTVSTSGSGLVFNNTYTASCSQAYISCIVSAENTLESLWNNSLTVNVTFDEQANGTSSNSLATNRWSSFINVSYSQLKNTLPASDSLPSTDPTGGHTWYLPVAYARMLGLTSSAPSTDDTVTLNSSYNWSFGQDVASTVEHEISEGVMGRVGGLGDQNGVWSTMDLFRYSSPGVRDFTDGRDGLTTFFSVNGSPLSSLSFNNEFSGNGTKANSGDTADFTQNDVFGTGFPGETTTFSQTDLMNMAALGWTPTDHVVPTITGHAFTVARNQSVALSPDITTSNPSSDSITSYWVEDLGGGGGHLAVGGVTGADGQWIQASSQWGNVQYVGGPSAGTDTIEVAMYDARTGSYVYSSGFAATTFVATSPNDTVIPVVSGTSTGAITDANGNVWAVAGGRVTVNGVVDSTTANVTELAYVNGKVWQENASDLWWAKTAPTDQWSPPTGTPKSPLPYSTSPNDTVITVVAGTSTGSLTDANGNEWAVAGGKVTVNGVVDPTTANVTELAYVNGKVWQENASDLWWAKTAPTDQWSPPTGTPKSPLPYSTSPNDTVITVVAGTSTGALTDANGNKWAVAGGKVTVNGVVDPTTANVTELAYVNGKVWQENASHLWWGKTTPTDQWSPASGTPKNPLPSSTSPNDTIIPVIAGTSTGTITDAYGNNWAVAGGKVTVNGLVDSTTANVTELAYVNGKVWQENASALWWGKTVPTDQWSPPTGTPTSPLPNGASTDPTTAASSAVISPSGHSVTGNDISKHIVVGTSAPVFTSGNADSTILPAAMGNLAIADNGQGTTIAVSVVPAAGATLTIHDFQHDATGLVSLPGQYLTTDAALASLRSDGQGGSILAGAGTGDRASLEQFLPGANREATSGW